MYLSKGDGTFFEVGHVTSGFCYEYATMTFVDFNGDGMADIICDEHGLWGEKAVHRVLLSNGLGHTKNLGVINNGYCLDWTAP